MASTTFFHVEQKTDKQHILDNPDTYIGSVESVESEQWVFDPIKQHMEWRTIQYVPGFYKLFDESIVNCRDHVVRMQNCIDSGRQDALPVTHIEVSVDPVDGTITMRNDGNGMDVEQQHGIWLPELVFGHLRTSTNYNPLEKKIVGGKNGFGFKLVLIWSMWGRIETVDHIRNLKYIQEFHHHLDDIHPPQITKATTKKPYTIIQFRPDYARLQMSLPLSDDTMALLQKRAYDIAAITDRTVKVKWNNEWIPTRHFAQYIDLYGLPQKATVCYESPHPRWEYAVMLSPQNEFMQVSFVNGIYTSKGGKHVDYILQQLVRKLVELIEKKKKVKVNSTAVKEQLMLFVRCDIENPAFDSQTKDFMNTPPSKFGSKCDISDKFVDKVAKMGVMEAACALTEAKETKAAKKTDGTKTKTIYGIPKLQDANWAGTAKSHLCTLILCEGDSAKAGVISGLSADDRNTIGVFPLKGKLMNVRGETKTKISNNEEIADLKKILGLESGRVYTSLADSRLRYGHCLLLTDQDLDGSHIKGLFLNLFWCEWPSLLQIPHFLGFMNTPIIIARRQQQERFFYHMGEYKAWRQSSEFSTAWNIKYYKGLGTSTAKEFQQYCRDQKVVWFVNGEECEGTMDLVFNKFRSHDRKEWLRQYQRDLYLDTSDKEVTYSSFVNRELIHYSKYDCGRNIPNVMDGLKISLRKILYAAFKKPIVHEIKVAQFSGYVSEHSAYHHGEASLNAAIVGMAQQFVGSNNIAVFRPNGQFGTRVMGGKDAASERYIFTQLHPITRALYPALDDDIYTYLDDDGDIVEPVFYAPILPMLLVNGSRGIGTGFSTCVLSYHPLHLTERLRARLRGESTVFPPLLPYFEGFKGTVSFLTADKILIKGTYALLEDHVVHIQELPVGVWTTSYRTFLGELLNQKQIVTFDEFCTDKTVDFRVKCTPELYALSSVLIDHGRCTELEKVLGLYVTESTTNMHAFDENEHLQKYATVEAIIDAYYPVRLALYAKRKAYVLQQEWQNLQLLQEKVRFIELLLTGTVDLRGRSKAAIHTLLTETYGFSLEHVETFMRMSMDTITNDKVDALRSETVKKQEAYRTLEALTCETWWLQELDAFEVLYHEYIRELQDTENTKSGGVENAKTTAKKRRRI